MSNEEIVQEIQNGINVTENMELLYRQNTPLIRKFIKPYSHYENIEDLEQESYFGLFEAAKNYDPNKEAKFITYARFWIVQAVYRYIQCNIPAVRIPSGLNGKINRYKKYVNKYLDNFRLRTHSSALLHFIVIYFNKLVNEHSNHQTHYK
mgnify:CR=1 FL=1